MIPKQAKALGLTPMGPLPNERQLEWYGRDKTAFFHFGMNTFTDKEWGDGSEDPAWFDPTDLDCRQWVRTIKEAGFDAAILTAKHHDGFCLWPSAYTNHSVKSSPYQNGKGDVVREFTDACAEFGIKAGIYLSPWDRHEPSWGSEDYNDFYVGQLTELLTNYGKIWEVWWDGAGSKHCRYDWKRWVDTVRTLQPDAVIFGSLGAAPYVDVRWVGNERGMAGKPCFSTIDVRSIEIEIPAELNKGDPEGSCFIPAEADVSIRPGWFYHAEQDAEVRSAAYLTELWFCSVGRNAGLLLNLPPDRRGLLCDADVQTLLSFNKQQKALFSHNLTEAAHIRASSVRSSLCPPESILCTEDGFYAPDENDDGTELVFSFDSEVTFNTMTLGEVTELGHQVREMELLADVDGQWKLLCRLQGIGHFCAERFDTVRTRRVLLRITKTVGTPLLRFFGLYCTDLPDPMDAYRGYVGKNLLADRHACVERDGNTFDIQLGGIRPFNCLKINCGGVRSYSVELFNGFSFDPPQTVTWDGAQPVTHRWDRLIDWSYRIRIRILEGEPVETEPCEMELYCDINQ